MYNGLPIATMLVQSQRERMGHKSEEEEEGVKETEFGDGCREGVPLLHISESLKNI